MKATIFLVHGTFARNAPWTQPGSKLRVALESIQPEGKVECVPISWSGANLQSHRLKAADDLYGAILGLLTVERAPRVLIVAHSHGGSIVNMMLSRHPELASRLSGLVFISTPFIQISRRAHTEGLRRLSEYLMAYFSPVIPIGLVVGLAFLIGSSADWWVSALAWFYFISAYLTFEKVVNARLPEISFYRWAMNILAIYAGTMLAVLPSAGLNSYLQKLGWNQYVSVTVGTISFAALAVLISKVWNRLGLLYETVGTETHVSASIQRIIEDFRQPEVSMEKSLYVRFTSDEASLSLALAQGFSKISEFGVNAVVAFFSVWSAGFRRALLQKIGASRRLMMIAVLLAWVVVATNTIVFVSFGIFGLLEASFLSLSDALLNLKVPNQWNWSHSNSMKLLEALEPYLKWSVDFGARPAAMLNLYLAIPLILLTVFAAILAIPFGAAYFWAAPYVNFSVEAAPTGPCHSITFLPPVEDNLEEDTFWNASQLAHSLGYSDTRSIEVIRERIARWLTE